MNHSSYPVLVIDDNHAIHDDIRKILAAKPLDSTLDLLEADLFGDRKERGVETVFEIDSAFQGQEGLSLVENASKGGRPYALAFVDMRMPPGWNGIETTEHLWSADPRLQVVICTAYSDHSWNEVVDRLGCHDRLLILKKPFDTVEIIQIAYAMTQKWSLHREVEQRLSNLNAQVAAHTAELERANAELRREIDERRRMEAELSLAQKLESVGRLAAGVAHEINTPTQFVGDNTRFLGGAFESLISLQETYDRLLDAARGGSVTPALVTEVEQARETADVEYLKQEIPQAVAQSLEGTQRISKIVSAMKEFSHPGRQEKESVDVNRVIENAVTVATNEWKYVAEVHKNLDPTLPTVGGYRAELGQVILNLIVNAAHAIGDVVGDGSKGKGRIDITTSRLDGAVEIRIKDSGTGIPEDIRSRVFDPFFTTKEVGKGTGQGLSIARSVVVDKHCGKLSLETEVGKGTTFIVQLPFNGCPEQGQQECRLETV
jgi:signal transduction histidine kinase